MKLYLSHRIDKFGFLDSYYYGIDDKGKESILSIEEIIDYKGEIVTYDLTSLLNELRLIYKGDIPIITDIGSINKIIIGIPRKYFPKGSPPWQFWNLLNKFYGRKDTVEMFKVIRQSSNAEEIIEILKRLCGFLKTNYEKSIKQLQENKQLERFSMIENPIQQQLNKRQIEGINIDLLKFEALKSQLEKTKNIMLHKLRFQHKIIDLNYKAIRLYLIEKGHKISNEDFDYFNLISYLKSSRITSDLCKDIYIALRAKFDYDTLVQYIPEDKDLVYPEFDCIGTITSRILITFPLIQQLKRENRIIFKAKEGYSLLYCDYKQFEPGILASLSNDKKMKEIYNSGDIYSEFSSFVFDTHTYRDEAKILFLSYLYGMSNKNLITSIEKIIKTKGLKKNASAASFFSQFSSMEKFKIEHSEKALKSGHIESEHCLRRFLRKNRKSETIKSEARFVLSQLIQGTASFILKKAILKCVTDGEIEFLIPMHDAALFQVPTKKLKEKREFIEKNFLEEYSKICPDINARVDFKDFDK